MKVYTDKQGISHEETIEFDKNNPRDVKIKKWFDNGLKPKSQTEGKKRPAIRLGDPNSIESVSRVVDRYGAIEDETFNGIIEWLDKNKDKYKYEIVYELGNRTIRTQRIGSFTYKITDNQKDASDTLKNLQSL